MADPKGRDLDDPELVFAAYNTHDLSCGRPPGVRNTAHPGLYHGYFENRYREQFVFTFDRATGTGTVSGGDLGRNQARTFSLDSVDGVLRSIRALAAQVQGSEATSNLPVIDAALALGRLSGLTGRDELAWLRACLEACTFGRPRTPEPQT
jgi:hypothetical protein